MSLFDDLNNDIFKLHAGYYTDILCEGSKEHNIKDRVKLVLVSTDKDFKYNSLESDWFNVEDLELCLNAGAIIEVETWKI